MKKIEQSAEIQLVILIEKLRENSKFLNNNEFISIISTLRSICTNQQFVTSLVQSLNVLKQTKINRKDTLTKREEQVLLLVGDGQKNSDIATGLNLSASTIETHRKNIRKKLKLNGHDNLFVLALLYSLQYHAATNDNIFK
jgi:two-component system nitrate/nitrite response regulator NarL